MNNCLVCNSKDIVNHVHSKDYDLTQENFTILKCTECGFAFTKDAPDENQIGRYYNHADYVSHSDTKDGLFFKLYHKVRDFMLSKKLTYIKQQKDIRSLIDIGAGTGYFVHHVLSNKIKAVGFEPDEKARKQALSNFNITLEDDLKQIVEKNEPFDAISLWHVLEHVHDLKSYFSYFNSLLNNNGLLAIAIPNYTSYDASFYKEYWAAYDLPKHLWHFSPESLKRLAEKEGFTHLESYAMPFDPFYISLLSEQHKQSSFLGKIRALIVGNVSFINGLFNAENASSVVYIFKKNS